MKKLIKFNHPHQPSIEVFNSSGIEKEKGFNAYGLYYIDEDFQENLQTYRKERNEYIASCIDDGELTLSEIKEQILAFQEDFCFDTSKGDCVYGRPVKFIENNDADFVTSLDGFYFEPYGDEVEEDDIEDCNHYVSWWDGSNHRKIYIDSEHGWTEDITDEFLASFDAKEFIGSNRENDSTRWTNYYYDTEKEIIWAENITCWQGERTDWAIIDEEGDIDVAFVKYGKDRIEDLRPEIYNKHGQNLEVINARETDCSCYEHEPSLSDLYEIFSKDDVEELNTWVNDPYSRTHGGTYYKHKDGRIIHYIWSAYQGSFCGYEESNMSIEEIQEL